MTVHELYEAWRKDGFFLDAMDLLQALGVSTAKYDHLRMARYIPPSEQQQIEHLIYTHYDPTATVPPIVAPIPSVDTTAPTTDDSPPQIQELKRRAKPLHKLQSHLHEQLRHAKDDDERYAIADRIMSEVIPAIDAIYAKVRGWEETGEVPFVLSLEAEQAVSMMKQRESLKPRISRLKKWLKSDAVPMDEKAKYQKELDEKVAELERIEGELGL